MSVNADIHPESEDPKLVDPNLAEENEDGPSSTTDIAVTSGSMVVGGMTGDVRSQFNFPWLSIVHGVGDLAQKFSSGDLVLDKEHLLARKGQKLNVIVLNTNTFWKEIIPFGAGAVRPRTFKTEAEAKAAGLATSWVDDPSVPRAGRAMTLRMLIEKPESLVCGLFGVEAGGKQWAPVRWAVDKSAFNKVEPKILQIAGFATKNKGLLHAIWTLNTDSEKRQKSGNVVTIPVLTYKGATDAKVVEDVLALFNPQPAAA